MELKEFIKSTLTEIMEGVAASQEIAENFNAVVNPSYRTLYKTEINGATYSVIDITFKIGLTEISVNENKKGIGVVLSPIKMGALKAGEKTDHSETTIEFSIPVVLPVSDHQK